MARIISAPTVIPAAGEPPKIIEEFIGQVNSATSTISVAKMTSPSGWSEPGQTPEFDEYTIVLRGELQVETREALHRVSAGQAIIVSPGGSGCVTVRPVRRARNTLPYACLLSRRGPCTETQSDGDENRQMQFSEFAPRSRCPFRRES